MNKVLYHIIIICLLTVIGFVACGGQKPTAQQEESREAKLLLQGVWVEEDGETAIFQMKGDSIFYADSTSLPARFWVIDDTLFVGSNRYPIERHTEHLLWFRNQNGDLLKFEKSEDTELNAEFEQSKPQILTITEVLKRDTVVFYDSQRYHLYIAINPTKYKVSHQTINEDGMEVENVYYDNIIHLSIFNGATQLFSRDFRKQQYAKNVPAQILQQSVLNNMEFSKVDASGFHFNVSVCVPDDASCYLIDQIIDFKGSPSVKLLEY